MQTGPDGRIYVAQYSPSLGVIDQPDQPLPFCGFDPSGLVLAPGTESMLGLPMFMAKPSGHMGLDMPRTGRETFVVAPNPADTEMTMMLPALRSSASVDIISSDGQVVRTVFVTGGTSTIDIRTLAKGRYICRVQSDSGEPALGSFIKN
ncbi:MAG: T9SS type A sorting domain-containing protein [Flavobacteriales bacterium]|nr:T9SS type A sorting domain-containing protein [Flavobacteriales bacterium]